VTNLGGRTTAYCLAKGWPCAKTEYWNSWAKVRKDLFGCIDYLVLDGLPGVLGVQVTDGSNASKRVAKCLEVIPPQWFEAGNRLEVWAWAKRGPAGKRKLWALRRVAVSALDQEDEHQDQQGQHQDQLPP
jgi:hypothetical protein